MPSKFKKEKLYNYGSKVPVHIGSVCVSITFSGFSSTELNLQIKWEGSARSLFALVFSSGMSYHYTAQPRPRQCLLSQSFWCHLAPSFLHPVPISLFLAFLNPFPSMYLFALDCSCVHNLSLV